LLHSEGDYGTAILSREAVCCLYAHARIAPSSYKQLLRWHATRSLRLLASHGSYMRTLQMLRHSYLQKLHYPRLRHVIEATSLVLSLVQSLPSSRHVMTKPGEPGESRRQNQNYNRCGDRYSGVIDNMAVPSLYENRLSMQGRYQRPWIEQDS
jgi:hypothetical protein